ncbi:molybdenum cofactor synthesis domain-containing protein [Colletotrichum higginsianum]|nr:molybdenum cofactor synthesis domain-containing protein [Colletotrichum higginsianum]
MTDAPLKVAILIVSTTASKDPSTDKSELVLRDVIENEGSGKWKVTETKIVQDHVPQIQRQIMLWADLGPIEGVNLILTTGGTGFAVSDNTPEDRPRSSPRNAGFVPGCDSIEVCISSKTVLTAAVAMMSRPVAGTRNTTVIVTLPGSPKGAKENLQAILKTLPHACVQAAGADSRILHEGGVKKLESDAGIGPDAAAAAAAASSPPQAHSHDHSHDHSHGHNHGHSHSHASGHGHGHGHGALIQRVTLPHAGGGRCSAAHKGLYPEPEVVTSKVDVSLVNSVLAEDVTARESVPAFRASIVDGYAVVVPEDGNLKGVFPVAAVSHAAPEGEIARITTGAPLPPGATSVIMVEDTVLKSMTKDEKEEKEVEILADGVKPGENIREIGSDIQENDVILKKGEQISGVGGEIGLLAAVGVAEVKTYKRPVVGILSTGDEIIEPDRPGGLRLGEVRDTNRITLMSAARHWGFDVIDLGIARDKAKSLEENLREGLRRSDLLITTGGVSMGELDLLKPTIERSLGGTIHFGRVAMKPGKPTTFATVPVKTTLGDRVTKTIFSLPGNPASALVTFHLFVLPALHKLSGIETTGLAKVPVTLAHDFSLDKVRPEYHRAIVTVGKDGSLSASSTGGQRSSKVGSLKSANALLALPTGSEPLKKGSKVEALLMGDIRVEL